MNAKTVDKMDVIDQLYGNNYKKYMIKDKSTLTNKSTVIDSLRIKIMMKPSFNDLDIVEIKKSKIHNNGVFAKRDIQIDEIITLYPVDILQLYVGNDESILNFSKRYKEKNGMVVNDINQYYKYHCDNRNIIIGDPAFIDNTNYLGHMINDGMKHDKSNKSRKLYKKLSEKKANCEFNNIPPYQLYVPVVAAKNIKKDEELFVSYGIQYWDNIE